MEEGKPQGFPFFVRNSAGDSESPAEFGSKESCGFNYL